MLLIGGSTGAPGTFGAPTAQLGLTFVVNSTADETDQTTGDGICRSASGSCTLRAAIMEANARLGTDTIQIPAGVYSIGIPGRNDDTARFGDLDITESVSLFGVGQGISVIDGATLDRVIDVISGETTLRNLSLKNGFATGAGNSGKGGGILVRSRMNMAGVALVGNVAAEGGGISTSTGAFVDVRDSVLTGNLGYDGGGAISTYDSVLNSNTQVYIRNSTISGNSAGSSAGAIAVTLATYDLRNVTLMENSGYPKDVYSNGGIISAQNSIFGSAGSNPTCS
jgi:large repetitive protein